MADPTVYGARINGDTLYIRLSNGTKLGILNTLAGVLSNMYWNGDLGNNDRFLAGFFEAISSAAHFTNGNEVELFTYWPHSDHKIPIVEYETQTVNLMAVQPNVISPLANQAIFSMPVPDFYNRFTKTGNRWPEEI